MRCLMSSQPTSLFSSSLGLRIGDSIWKFAFGSCVPKSSSSSGSSSWLNGTRLLSGSVSASSSMSRSSEGELELESDSSFVLSLSDIPFTNSFSIRSKSSSSSSVGFPSSAASPVSSSSSSSSVISQSAAVPPRKQLRSKSLTSTRMSLVCEIRLLISMPAETRSV